MQNLINRKPTLLHPVLILPFFFGFLGCPAATHFSDAVSQRFTRASLRSEYRKALQDFDRGDYTLAATRFESLIDRYPDGAPEKEELLFRQGKAYYYLKNYHDAQESVKEYLRVYPSGPHQTEASQDLVLITAARSTPNPVAQERLQASKKNLEDLLKLEKEYPTDPQIKYYLGNIYYELGQYKEAGRYYFQAQAFEAAYKEKELIKERLFINAQGEPETLTPDVVLKLDKERNPLVVFDQRTYYDRNNQDAFNGRQVFANVTGKVRNQGSRTVRGVELEVRFLNPLSDILDFQTIRLGDMDSGEVRPFLALARHYDDLLNVQRVEVFAREAR